LIRTRVLRVQRRVMFELPCPMARRSGSEPMDAATPDGQIATTHKPRVAAAYERGSMVPLLPAATGRNNAPSKPYHRDLK
jgi:hypothetical protein